MKILFATALSAVAIALLGASVAQAEFGITDFGVSVTRDGELSRQAGEHADLTTTIRFATHPDENGKQVQDGEVRDVKVALPPGIVGNPTAAPTCLNTELVDSSFDEGKSARCPISSQVGIITIDTGSGTTDVPIYNMEQPPDLPALFAFNYQGAVVRLEPRVRSNDYGITVSAPRTSQSIVVVGATVTIWAVPSDPSHDALRFSDTVHNVRGASSSAPRLPFLSNPTSCLTAASVVTASANSWQDPGTYSTVSVDRDFDGTPLITEGCDRLAFTPSITVQPGSRLADAPTGLNVHLSVPQTNDPDGLATANVRKVAVTLPEGMSVSASSAAGLGACAPAEIKLGSDAEPICPDSSKIGTVSIDTPLLDEALEGDVILAKQNDNPFGSLLALYIVARGPGVVIKLPGRVDADPVTGQLTTTFDNNPQLPFSDLTLALRGGPRASLVTPRACGVYSTNTEITSWASDVPVKLSSPMVIDQGCTTGSFDPGLSAGTVDPSGGSFSPFVLRITRDDGDANLSRIEATLPEGLLAKLAGVPLCSEPQAASGDCPAGSQVGTTTVGVGPGSNPIYIREAGKAPTAVYLAGPFKGAPYSLVVKVPAQAGPFDLGTVVVRNALQVDTTTAQVTAVSDPLPQILQGIPIAYRDVRVEVNRPDFTINPTSCKPMAVMGVLTSATGQTATPSSPFQASGCKELGFGPSLKLSLKGKMNRTGNPAVKAVLKAPKGQANIAKTTVVLPKSQFIDNSHINNPCTRVQFNEDKCPAGSILGKATAYTPLLDKPLTGPVYFRSNGGDRELPDLVADLDGQIHVTLVGFIDTARSGGVRTRFQDVPDAPVSRFVLRLSGGRKGLIENSRDLCSFTPKAKVQMTGQNGKAANSSLRLGTSCGKAQRKK